MRNYAKYLYVMTGGGFHKIGIAYDPMKRLKEFNLPFDLELVHALEMESPRIAEEILHACFAHKRARGEWFVLDPVDMFLIKSLKTSEDFLRIRLPYDRYTIRYFNGKWGVYYG